MVMQQVEEMTLTKAIEAIESLLEAFAFRSGGGDGEIINNSIRALAYLQDMQKAQVDKSAVLQEAINTGDSGSILKLLEVLRFELIVVYLEDVALLAPYNSEARGLAKQILVYLHRVRDLLNLYYQEVEHANDDQ